MLNFDRPIGVFDSGMGGISVLKELKSIMPNEDYIYFGDSLYAPYGTKNKEAIVKRCENICDFLLQNGVKAIVIACNTATSVAVNLLREKYQNIPIVGMEPALKVAAHQKSNNNIVVMATELTLNEEKFKNLMEKYSFDNNIIKIPCPKLVEIVENNFLDDKKMVKETLSEYLFNISNEKIDSIVLGCTHFVFFRKTISELLGENVKIIDGNLGTSLNLKNILNSREDLKLSEIEGNIIFKNSSDDKIFDKIVETLMNNKY